MTRKSSGRNVNINNSSINMSYKDIESPSRVS